MTLGFISSGFYVNCDSGIAPEHLIHDGAYLTDWQGMISL